MKIICILDIRKRNERAMCTQSGSFRIHYGNDYKETAKSIDAVMSFQ